MRPDGRGRRGEVVLARSGRANSILVAILALLVVLVTSATVPDWPDLTAVFGVGTFLACYLLLFGAVLSERVVGEGSVLVLRNFLVDVRIPASKICNVWAEAGSLLIETNDWKVRRPGAFAARSGVLSGVGRYVRAAAAVRSWLERLPEATQRQPVRVRYRLRRYWYTTSVLIVATCYGWCYLLWVVMS